MNKKRLLVFASGSREGGGSGFEKLHEASLNGILNAEIVAVVSNHKNGGVRERANRLCVDFIHSPKGRTAEDYRTIVRVTEPDFISLSGWLGIVPPNTLDSKTTFNIHPAWLPSRFGGTGYFGHHVHEAVIASYREGNGVIHSGVSMHFVTSVVDDTRGLFFRRKVEILPGDSARDLAKRVNEMEHLWQSKITNRVVEGKITWDGVHEESLIGADLE